MKKIHFLIDASEGDTNPDNYTADDTLLLPDSLTDVEVATIAMFVSNCVFSAIEQTQGFECETLPGLSGYGDGLKFTHHVFMGKKPASISIESEWYDENMAIHFQTGNLKKAVLTENFGEPIEFENK